MSRGPIKWRPQRDKEILAAVERQANLHAESVEAQREAQRAIEAIAAAQAESDEARSDALAAGKPDPGAVDTSELERAAEAASERRDLLASAAVKARAAALKVADERAQAWERESDKALGAATGNVVGAIDVLATALDDWQAARGELALSQSSSLRERGRPVAGTMPVGRLLGPNGEAIALPTVIEALRALITETPAPGREPVEPQPQPLTADERRELVSRGVEIHGPGR